MNLNKQFKKFRLSQNLNQIDFATKLQVSQGTVSDIEREEIGVSKNVIKKLKQNFNIDFPDIGTFDSSQKEYMNENLHEKVDPQSGPPFAPPPIEGEISPYPANYWEDKNFNVRQNFEKKLLLDIWKNHPEVSAIESPLRTIQQFEYIIINLNRSYFFSIENQFHSATNYLKNGKFDYEAYKADYIKKLQEFEPIKPALNALSEAIETFYKQMKDFDTNDVIEGYFGVSTPLEEIKRLNSNKK